MYSAVRAYLLKKLYKCLIFKTIVVDKTDLRHYSSMKEFCSIDVHATKGVFTFIFKEDRRKKPSPTAGFPYINNYIIELTVPEGLAEVNNTLREKIVIVVKVMLYKVDYEILTQVLADVYLDVILNYSDHSRR